MDARMENLPIKSIFYGDRARTDMGNLQALGESIRSEGLINPVTVLDCEKAGVENPTKFRLLAGGRRYYTCWKFLQWETIPARIYEEVPNPETLKMIELVENIQRKDMTPAEELKLKNEVYELQKKLLPQKVARDATQGYGTITDTAKLLNVSREGLGQDLKLSQTMALFPQVDWTQFKSKTDIKKMVSKLTRNVTTQAAACEVEKKLGDNPNEKLLELACNCYLVNDFFEGVKSVEDRSVDFVEIDPPFGIDLKNNKKGKDTGEYNEIEDSGYISFINSVLRQCFRVMKHDSWGILWFAPEPWTCLKSEVEHPSAPNVRAFYNILTEALANSGFSYCGVPAVWFKAKDDDSQSTGQTNMPDRRLATSCEYFYYFWKGQPKLHRQGMTNGFNYRPVPAKQKYHPTQKPIELYTDIYTTFVGPGSRCMIPFLGSGVSLLAAFSSKMSAFGWELSDSFRSGYVVEAQKIFTKGENE